MIPLIDKQIEFLNLELKNNQENVNVVELIRVLELFKEVFNTVLTGERNDASPLALFVSHLLTGKGEVDFVNIASDFMLTHKVTQSFIHEKTGIPQARVSDFLNRKHAMQSDTMTKLFSVIAK